MKKIVSLVLVLIMCLSMALMFTSCGNVNPDMTEYELKECITDHRTLSHELTVVAKVTRVSTWGTTVKVMSTNYIEYYIEDGRFTTKELSNALNDIAVGQYVLFTVYSIDHDAYDDYGCYEVLVTNYKILKNYTPDNTYINTENDDNVNDNIVDSDENEAKSEEKETAEITIKESSFKEDDISLSSSELGITIYDGNNYYIMDFEHFSRMSLIEIYYGSQLVKKNDIIAVEIDYTDDDGMIHINEFLNWIGHKEEDPAELEAIDETALIEKWNNYDYSITKVKIYITSIRVDSNILYAKSKNGIEYEFCDWIDGIDNLINLYCNLYANMGYDIDSELCYQYTDVDGFYLITIADAHRNYEDGRVVVLTSTVEVCE